MKTKETSIKFNKKIYPKKAVFGAIADYGGFARFSLTKKGNYFFVSISGFERDMTVLDEFSNHVISLMK